MKKRFFYWIFLLLMIILCGAFMPKIWCNDICSAIFRFLGVIFIMFGVYLNYKAGKTLKKFGHKIKTNKFTAPDKFVNVGIYKCMRHPGQFGNLFILLGVAFIFAKVLIIFLAGWIMFFGILFILYIEEKEAIEKFDEYCNYIKTTPPFSFKCLFINFTKKTS
jgi:protein-S-isoprenylcysteine O-methyltransferase Ste14